MTRRIVIAGAGGRDFHDFNTVFRDDRSIDVVAFTATQIPGIDDRRYPAELAGSGYPDGIPIRPQSDLVDLISSEQVDDVVFSYSDVAYADVMHLAAKVNAAGAGFRLLSRVNRCCRARVPSWPSLPREPVRESRPPPAGWADSCSTQDCESRSSGTRCPTAICRRCGSSGSPRWPTSMRLLPPSRSARSTRSRCVRGW